MSESLGPHFFSQISREEGSSNGGDAPERALNARYYIELSANGLGLLDTGSLEEYQVGSATISLAETRFQVSGDVHRSCKIEQLDFETENFLTKIQAFAAMLHRIESFCVKNHVEHLEMAPIQGSCWFSGLLEPAGFKICGCKGLDEHADVGIQVCMILPTPQIGSPTCINEDCPTVVLAVGENDKAVAAPKDRLAGDLDIRYNQALREMAKEAKSLKSQQVPAEGRVSLNPSASIKPINEIQRAQHLGGNDTLVSNFNARARATPSAEIASTATPHQHFIDQTGSIALASSNTSEDTRPAAKITGFPGALPKVYCMYWIRKGECDYTQRGCQYKHEIPVDEETRQRIGLREIPPWFQRSPEYGRFLQQVDRSATGISTGLDSKKRGISASESSREGRDRSDSDTTSRSRKRPATSRRDPVKMGPFTVRFPQEDHHRRHRSRIASNTNDQRAGPRPRRSRTRKRKRNSQAED